MVQRSWIVQERRVSVRACVPSDASPSAPSCPPSCLRSATWRSTCAGPGTRRPRTCSPPSTPTCGRRPGATPCACWVRSAGSASRRWPRTRPSGSCSTRPWRTWTPTCRGTGGSSALLRPTPACHGRSATSPRSSGSRRCCRSTPVASASWPATTSRPPATSASRSSASACSTDTVTSSSRSPARAGSRRPTPCSTPTSSRSRCCASPPGSPRPSPSRCPAARTCWPGSGWRGSDACRCSCSTPTWRATASSTST